MNQTSSPDLSIVIPFYNEEGNVDGAISDIVQSLSGGKIDYEIIAVNNGSTDRTGTLLEEISKTNPRISVCTVQKNVGYGWGVISGLKQARGNLVGYMWGDRQVEADSLLKIFRRLKEEGLDFCKVKRINKYDKRYFRKIQSWAFNFIFFMFFGINNSDVNGCPKVMKKDVYLKIVPQSKDWFIDSEIMIKLKKSGYSIGEVPVEAKKREKGKSKVRPGTILEFIKNICAARFRGLP